MRLGSGVLPAAAVDRRGIGGRLGLLSGLVCGLLLLLPAPAASAHAFLTSSTPADGQTLAAAPAEIRMQFSESVMLSAMSLDIVDSHGRHFRPTSMRIEQGAGTEDPVDLIAAIPTLARDAYRMSWETLSSDDLHRTNGLLVFGVATAVSAAGSVEPTPPPDEVLLRAGIFLSLSVALGGLLASRLLRTTGTRDDALLGRMRLAAAWGAGAGLVFGLALFADQALQRGNSLQQVLFSSFGLHFALRAAGFVLLLAAALRPVRLPRTAFRRALITVGSLAVGIDTALMGHSAAGLVASTTRVAADTAHLLAASTWSGVLLLTLLAILPAARRSGVDVAATLRTFAVPAAICVAVMIVTGSYLASGVVGSVDALVSTFYGRTLLVKLALVVLVSALGLANHRRLRRRDRQSIPVRTIALEAGVAAGILLLVGVLTSSQPAMEPQYIREPTAAVVPVRDAAAGDLQETLAVRTNVPGRNLLVATVFDTRRPAPAPIRGVLITLVDPGGAAGPTVPAVPIADGTWSVSTDIEWTQPFSVRLTVRRPGLPDTVATYPWVLAAASGQQRAAVVSDAPIREPLRAVSAVSLALAIAAGAVALIRTRSRRTAVMKPGPADVPVPQQPDPAPDLIHNETTSVLAGSGKN